LQRDEAHAATVRRHELTRRLELLGQVAVFRGLPGNERSEVAARLQYAPFARGDVITKQGNTAHWLYIMAFGDAEVLYEPPSGPPQVLALLRPGQFFGEMALMAGDARTATVVAKTDVECWRLDRGSFQQLLQMRPEIAEEVKRVIGARRGDLERAREAFAAAVIDTAAAPRGGVLCRVRGSAALDATMNSTASASERTAGENALLSATRFSLFEFESWVSNCFSWAIHSFAVAPPSRAILRPTRSIAWMPVVPS